MANCIIVRKASIDDLKRILELRDLARNIMRANGNHDQWPEGYPTEETFLSDIEHGHSYVMEEGGTIVATWAFIPGPDPTYSIIYNGSWIDDELPYYVVHRIASTPDSHGVMDAMLEFCFSQTNCLRIDTHRDNLIMQHILQKHDFKYCGIIHIANGDERLAFQKIINNQQLYTIGHSNHTQEEFIAMLRQYGIDCIVDVRSIPSSKHVPQFNQDVLKWQLEKNSITYLHFGNEFGARRTDCLNAEGQVDFELATKAHAFLNGVKRIQKGLERGYHIAFMCSEANPLECHRFSLVSRYFYDYGYDVLHILHDGTLTSHAELEKELIEELRHSKKYHLRETDPLFGSYTDEEQLNDAYRLKNKEIGYRTEEGFEID